MDRFKHFSLLDIASMLAITFTTLWLVSGFFAEQETPQQAENRRARDGVMILQSALAGYVIDLESPPPASSEGGLQKLIDSGYLSSELLDPWGNPYQYLHPGRYAFTDIWSRGPDGIDSDDDIVSWDLYGSYIRQ